MFMLGGLFFLVNAFLNLHPVGMVVVIASLIIVIPAIYSYVVFKKAKK